MHLPEGRTDWQELYKLDIEVAENEFALRKLIINPDALVGDIYVLPSQNHKAYYGKITCENKSCKLFFTKTIQKSVWFSEHIYMYSISETKKFEEHPRRQGQIICGCAPITNQFVADFKSTMITLSDEQPEDVVTPSSDAVLTALRLYESGSVIKEIFFTDAAKLKFTDKENPDAVDYLNNLYLTVEKIVGIGE